MRHDPEETFAVTVYGRTNPSKGGSCSTYIQRAVTEHNIRMTWHIERYMCTFVNPARFP